MRDVEFNYALDSTSGIMAWVKPAAWQRGWQWHSCRRWANGHDYEVYRDWQLSGNTAFLQQNWPKIKRALAFAWVPDGWDGNLDGVMDGAQHNTMDVEYFGPNPQMQIWYLGALKAAEKMAEAMNDAAFLQQCKTLFQSGSTWSDQHLFNGEYYEQQVMSPVGRKFAKGTLSGWNSTKGDFPPFQLTKGCLVDQLVGQFMAHVCGLGYLVKPQNVQTSLKSILKYNYRASLTEHFNNMRSYALADEPCSQQAFNKGRPPTIRSVFCRSDDGL